MAKLKHQSIVLRHFQKPDKAKQIDIYAKQVLSGDPQTREAAGARIYWKALFGDDFSRDPDGKMPNSLLNYGYALLRASVARAICSSGLSPVFGIHHENSTNSLPLADELMEPYRPLVDYYVKHLLIEGITEVNPAAKQMITRFLWSDLHFEGETTPFYAAMERFAFSLVTAFKTKKPQIEIAEMKIDDDTRLEFL
jgi:CRISPR-associated protein Cas1